MSRLNDILKSLKPDKTNRLRVIILCVFAATSFWFLNALNENYSTTLKYPLEFIYDKETYIAVEEFPEHVQVNVTGLGWNLFRNSLGIKVTPLKIVLETPSETKTITGGAIPGLISDQMNEVQLNYVLTDSLYIDVDRRISKFFPVKIDSTGILLRENYRIVTPVSFVPDSVLLEGPQKIIENMSDTLIVEITQEDIDEDFEETVPVDIPNNNLIRRKPPTLKVAFGVEEFSRLKQTVPLKTENFPEEGTAYVENNNITVEFLVGSSKQERISADDFEAIVDFRTMNPSDSTLVPKLIGYPDFVDEVSLDTTRIKVYFNEK